MYTKFTDFLADKESVCIIQAENPDGDSLGSAIALDYLLNDKNVSLYCPIDIPKYLHYFDDWSRVTNEFDFRPMVILSLIRLRKFFYLNY